MTGNGRYFQDVGEKELGVSMRRVFFKQFFENDSGLGSKTVEKVLPLAPEPLGAFPPGVQWGVEGKVAKQIEGIGLRLPGGVGQLFEYHPPFGQPLDDLGTPFGVGPLGAQFRRGRAEAADLLRCVIGVVDNAQLFPVRVEFVDEMRRDLDAAAVEVEFPPFLAWRFDDPAFAIHDDFRTFVLVNLFNDTIFSQLLFGQMGRVAVEIRVGELARG